MFGGAPVTPGTATGQPQPKAQEYAFTEIKTFHIPVGKNLEDGDSSEEGQIWAHTIRTYLENEGTGLVWWGRLFDVPSVVKLVIGMYLSIYYITNPLLPFKSNQIKSSNH